MGFVCCTIGRTLKGSSSGVVYGWSSMVYCLCFELKFMRFDNAGLGMVMKKKMEGMDRKARRLKSREGHEGKKETNKHTFF